jgi:hypothetical protein
MAKVKDSHGFAGLSVRTKENDTGVADSGRVRIGNTSPPFPLTRPLSRPITVSDAGTAGEPNVRIAAVRSR